VKDKLFWEDAYKLEFEAEIVARADRDKLPGIVLDGTYFYPEGGGQPSDRGTLGGAKVVDVQEDADADQIVHYLDPASAQEDALAVGATVAGIVDGEYRKQNMRAHTGAHLLFGAARKLFSTLEYAGFDIHGGGGSLYLQTDGSISAKQLHRMLEHANTAMVDERAVGTYFVKPEEVANIPGCVWNVMLPEDNVRIVEIEGWDVAVCSGTHFARTIEVGPVSVIGREPHKKGVTRLDYVVGTAAVGEIVASERALGEIVTLLSAPRDEAGQATQKLVNAVAEERKRADKLQKQLAAYRFEELLAEGQTAGDVTLIVGSVPDVAQDALRPLVAKAAQERERAIVAVVGQVDRSFIVAGRSEDFDLDLREPVVAVAKQHGGGGGGAPHLVSAGGMGGQAEAVVDDLREALEKAIG